MLPPSNQGNEGVPMWLEDEPGGGTIINPVGEAAPVQDKEGGNLVDKIEIAEELPVLPLKDTVIYPHIVAPLLVTEDPLIKLIDDALAGDRIVAVFTAKEGVEDDIPKPEDLYDVGSAVAVARRFKLPDGKMQLLVQGIARIKAVEHTQPVPYPKAKIERLAGVRDDTVQVEALARNALNLFRPVSYTHLTLPTNRE